MPIMLSSSVLHFLACTALWVSGIQSKGLRLVRTSPGNTGTTTNPFASIPPSSTLTWSPCYSDTPASQLGNISCARLLEPLDYANTSIGNVQLAILKLSGSGTGQSPNAVFFNPGGPGDDPIEYVLSNAEKLRANIGNASDIIAIAPRGVGSTLPAITCDASDLAAAQTLWEISNTLPGEYPNSLEETYAIGQNFALDCAQVTPKLLLYIGTVYVAHDMEFVRHALGQEKLNYLGHSYGTVLGGTYAALFPDKVGRMVLDGVLDFNDYYSANKDPNLDIGDADLALHNFFEACRDAGENACAIWANTTQGVRNLFMKADSRIRAEPIPVEGFGLITWPLWRSGVYNALYRPSQGFPLLAGVASEILEGSAGPYIEAYVEIVQGATSSADTALMDPNTGLKNSPNAGTYISCSDSAPGPKHLSTQQLNAEFARYEKVSTFFGGISAQFVIICQGAHLPSNARYTRFQNITTANPILFVGNTADPTTPIRNAHRMSAAFVGSRVLTVNGTGHISTNAAENDRCGRKWIAPYFENGTLPDVGTVCDGMQKFFASDD